MSWRGLSAGSATDLEIALLEGAVVDDRGDHLVITTPSNPGYRWGNYVRVTTGDVEDAERWLGVFTEEFPRAGWVAIGLPVRPRTRAYEQAGCSLDEDESLVTRTLPVLREPPSGYDIRQLAGDAEWNQLVEADVRERSRTHPGSLEAFRRFKLDQVASRRSLQEAGRLGWWGAFDGDGRLCANLGIVLLGERARYQAVFTEAGHRGRGLAGHLLGLAARWAAERGASEWVIVTETTNEAGRLYRSLGFVPELSGVSAYREPVEELPS